MVAEGKKSGKELKVLEGRDTVVKIYCMRKESMFNERKKEKLN